MRNFAVYSKDGCPYCSKIESVLDIAGLNYVVYKLDEHFTKEAFYGEFGEGSAFPQVKLNGENIGGCQECILYLQKENICCTI